jgi:hypothetical protein
MFDGSIASITPDVCQMFGVGIPALTEEPEPLSSKAPARQGDSRCPPSRPPKAEAQQRACWQATEVIWLNSSNSGANEGDQLLVIPVLLDGQPFAPARRRQ